MFELKKRVFSNKLNSRYYFENLLVENHVIYVFYRVGMYLS